MQKHKTKIISLIVVLISLMSAWALGGSPGDGSDIFLSDITATEYAYMPSAEHVLIPSAEHDEDEAYENILRTTNN